MTNSPATIRDQFIAFCAAQGDRAYDYMDSQNCPNAEFGRFLGYPDAIGRTGEFIYFDGDKMVEFTVLGRPTDDFDNAIEQSVEDWTALQTSTNYAELTRRLSRV